MRSPLLLWASPPPRVRAWPRVQKCIEMGPASNGRSRETRTHRGLFRVDAPIITPRAGTVVIKLLEAGWVLLAPSLPAKTSRLPVPTLGKRRPSQRQDEYVWNWQSTIVTFKFGLNLAHVGPHPQPHRKLTLICFLGSLTEQICQLIGGTRKPFFVIFLRRTE